MPTSLRARTAAIAVIALGTVFALAVLARMTLPLSPAFPAKAGVCFALVAAVVVARITAVYHPFARFGRANQMTMARAVFVALVAGTIGEFPGQTIAASAAAAATAVTMMDGVDGWVARRENIASAFGARFDMEVDALLILTLSILAWTHDKAGAWVILSGLLRYLFVAAGWIWPWMARPLAPSRRRKAVCVIQIVALVAVVEPFMARPLSATIAACALAVLSASFLVDTSWLVRHRGETA